MGPQVNAHDHGAVELAARDAGDLLESPVWDHRADRLLMVDAFAGRVLTFGGDLGHVTELADFGGLVGCVGLAGDGGLIVGAVPAVHLLTATGERRYLAPMPAADDADGAVNDGKVDRHGAFWIGSTTYSRRVAAGDLLRLGPGSRTLEVAARGFTLSNGLDWTADGRTLYHADSRTGLVVRHRLDADGGSITATEPFLAIDAREGLPDGLTVDTDDAVWLALWGAGEVRRYTPEGSLDRVLRLPARNVTSCCFGGSGLDSLYVTTARLEADDPQGAADLGGSLFVAAVGAAGSKSGTYGAAHDAV